MDKNTMTDKDKAKDKYRLELMIEPGAKEDDFADKQEYNSYLSKINSEVDKYEPQ